MTWRPAVQAANGRPAYQRATLTWSPRGAKDGRAGQRLVWAVYLTREEFTPIIENIRAPLGRHPLPLNLWDSSRRLRVLE